MKYLRLRLSGIALCWLVWVPLLPAAQVGQPAGQGPWPAVAETVPGLPRHTLFHPVQFPDRPLPLFVWGNGGCSGNNMAHAAYLSEIASRGYFVVALGTPGESSAGQETQATQLLEAIDWAERESARAGSPFKGRIDLSRIAAGGHSCGGLQALAVSHDPRIRTTLVLNSGIYIRPGGRSNVQIDKSQLQRLHGALLYLSGGPTDIAHENATDDVQRIAALPVFFGALPVGHGGTFGEPHGGEWAAVSARWLDWQLRSDADASWDFAGAACRLCSDGRWTVVQKNLPPPQGPLRQSLYVPVRDGTRLAMHLYRPAQDGQLLPGRLPVLFTFTPYRARFRDPQGNLHELEAFPRGAAQSLLDAGYVLAVADIRGKGASFGARRGFQDRTEAQDGHDLVAWLASRDWSSGRVGMYGCSYLGGTTLQVASTVPPALRAIFTGASDLDKFAFVRNGGITAQFNTRPDEPLSDDLMSLPVDADLDGALLRTAVAAHAGNTPMAALWYGMPYRDSVSPLTGNRFWEEVGPYTYLPALRSSGIATYFWSNLQDEPTAQMILAAANLGGRLLIGPGSHCAPPPGFDLNKALRQYFDQYLKDGPPSSSARTTWWLDGAPGAQNWRQDARWPGMETARERWYLAPGGEAGGVMQRTASSAASRPFTVDYDLGPPDAFAFWVESQYGRGPAFTTAVFDSPRTLVGFPLVHLRITSDRPEPSLFVYLELLPPSGKPSVLAFGRLAAAYRKTGRAPYDTLGLPWHTGLAKDHSPLSAGKVADLDFSLTPLSQIIPAGSRLRVVVTGADPRQRNLQQIRIDPPPRITLQLGKEGSWIELPQEARSSPQSP